MPSLATLFQRIKFCRAEIMLPELKSQYLVDNTKYTSEIGPGGGVRHRLTQRNRKSWVRTSPGRKVLGLYTFRFCNMIHIVIVRVCIWVKNVNLKILFRKMSLQPELFLNILARMQQVSFLCVAFFESFTTVRKMSRTSWTLVWPILPQSKRVARFFLTQYTKTRENIPNYHNITKWS
jgi:hypothetical protein